MNAQGKVIATDLDGTLFYPKKRFRMINSGNKIFLRKFIDQGGKVVLVSGRNVNYLEKTKRRLKRPVDFAGCNGAFIKVDDTFIKNIDHSGHIYPLKFDYRKYWFELELLLEKHFIDRSDFIKEITRREHDMNNQFLSKKRNIRWIYNEDKSEFEIANRRSIIQTQGTKNTQQQY